MAPISRPTLNLRYLHSLMGGCRHLPEPGFWFIHVAFIGQWNQWNRGGNSITLSPTYTLGSFPYNLASSPVSLIVMIRTCSGCGEAGCPRRASLRQSCLSFPAVFKWEINAYHCVPLRFGDFYRADWYKCKARKGVRKNSGYSERDRRRLSCLKCTLQFCICNYYTIWSSKFSTRHMYQNLFYQHFFIDKQVISNVLLLWPA